MARFPFLRTLLRGNTPAKLLLLFFALVFLFAFPFSSRHTSIFADPALRKEAEAAPLSELGTVYERVRLGILDARRFNGSHAAEKLRAPKTLPDGTLNFDPDLETYVGRLRWFVNNYLRSAPPHIQIAGSNTLKNLVRRLPAKHRDGDFPTKVWATHPRGMDGVESGFELWGELLPFPLPPSLANQLSPNHEVVFLKPARVGKEWDVEVLDDDGLDNAMSEWTGEEIVRGAKGEGKWSQLWGKLDKGVLRADLFRYVSMLVEGGIYSDSDTMPISHPYVWGLHAPSILDQDLEVLNDLMVSSLLPKFPPHNRSPQTNSRSIIDSDNSTYTPPYPGLRLSRRAPVYTDENPNPSSILNPSISMVVAIEWDSQIGRTLGMWKQWTWFRITRSWKDCCFPRGLEMVQNLLVSKPFHPIMMDTVATIAQLVETGVYKELSPLELTGPGPFTDAVFRYLLVQYGVTPDELRALRGPVRVGDILILQEEAWHAPRKAIQRLKTFVDSLRHKLGTNRHGRYSPWLFGLGYKDWKSGGVKVAYHGLTGIWK
ncbi:alpha-1,6-mannosyltransferase [Cryptococcus neoformans]|nr:alpha-1,6-mannosyltransferase [Cryptococcus neoformans var. grubii]